MKITVNHNFNIGAFPNTVEKKKLNLS